VYPSALRVDDQPLSLSAEVQAKATPAIGMLRQRLLLGAAWTYDANLGQGELYDLQLPPYPSSKSTRPRPYSSVPALQKLALYAEDDMALPIATWTLNVRWGARATTLPQLRSMAGAQGSYAMAGRWYVEPRVNATLALPHFMVGGRKGLVSLSAGYGRHYKLPTQAQLYPSSMYFDYIQLNYYSQQESLRTVNLQTYVEDPTSYALQPALNTKYEAGLRVELAKAELLVTLFDERMDNGFSSAYRVASHAYKRYNAADVPPSSIATAPKVEDFSYVGDTLSALFSTTTNSAQVHKRGIEYQLNAGRIAALYTSVRLTGAWFVTAYKEAGLRYHKPSGMINGSPYPYVGVYGYNNTDNCTRQQLNTNLYLDTHIPLLRMVFTTSVQAVWFTKTGYERNDGLPLGYIDNAGRYQTFTAADAALPLMQQLVDGYNERYFDTSEVPLAASLNLKLTKEIGDLLRISFYVNRLLSYLPDYIDKYGLNRIRTAQPSFGAELNLKF
jgi:hypothetical protein